MTPAPVTVALRKVIPRYGDGGLRASLTVRRPLAVDLADRGDFELGAWRKVLAMRLCEIDSRTLANLAPADLATLLAVVDIFIQEAPAMADAIRFTLTVPVRRCGQEVHELKVRRPSDKDLAGLRRLSDVLRSRVLMARLTDTDMRTIQKLDLGDSARLSDLVADLLDQATPAMTDAVARHTSGGRT
jgi:hypothetical protein